MREYGLSVNGRQGAAWLEAVRAAGFTRCEVSDAREEDTPDRAEKTCREAEAAGLRPNSLHIPFGGLWDVSDPDQAARQGAVSRIRPYMGLAAAVKAGFLVLHPSQELHTEEGREARLAALGEALPTLCDEAEKWGVTLCMENLPRLCLGNTHEEMLRILALDTRLRMVLDSNHMLRESVTDFAAPCAGKIVTTHLSDYDGIDERHWLPGRGICDFRGLFALLEAADYTGVYNMELREPYTPGEAMAALRQFC